MRQIRIGIDVGGTFTDAVAIDNATREIIAQEKIPTTHQAAEGVAEGIILVLQNILQKNNIRPEEVIFIAHGTTQATNALLEGDVPTTGILALGSGLEGLRVTKIANIGNIPLAGGKELKTLFAFVDTEDAAASADEITAKIQELKNKGAAVIAATEAYSVDSPENEDIVIDLSRRQGLYATAGHEVSKLYGLKVRTRTAVVNGSLIPRMMQTANMTEACVKRSGIPSSLMIMRCDGGVMTIDEVRHRPILTMLSGLAAGVAGVLMYEKLSDGIFLEAGGTSTDISVIKNGQVMVHYAEIGGHKTYLSSLDVRTIGVAGGSMIRVEKGKITDVGPRSAHIAGLAYEVFSPAIKEPKAEFIAPLADDDQAFVMVKGRDGQKAALTLAGAANLLDSVPPGDYAYSSEKEKIRAAWQTLGDILGCSAEEAARQAMEKAAEKIWAILQQLQKDYKLDPDSLCLAGGGGSGGIIVPYLGKKHRCQWKIVKNAPIISTIGVAMAMVREVVERTTANPTLQDIKTIRHEAMTQIMKSGAKEETVDIAIEIDKKTNTLRAIAAGTITGQNNTDARQLTAEDLLLTAANSLHLPKEKVSEIAATGKWHIFEGLLTRKICGIFTAERHLIRVLDRDGVITLQREGLGLISSCKEKIVADLRTLWAETITYGTVGEQLPNLYAYYGEKQLDLSGLADKQQIIDVLKTEIQFMTEDESILLLAVK